MYQSEQTYKYREEPYPETQAHACIELLGCSGPTAGRLFAWTCTHDRTLGERLLKR